MYRHSQPGQFGLVALFDIDGTLLRGPTGRKSAGFLAMHEALSLVVKGGSRLTDVDFAGQTDRRIARLLLHSAGEHNPSEERIDQLLAHYLDNLEALVEDLPYEVIGDPGAAVAALRQRGVIVGIGTGNLRSGARIKLQNAGLLNLFDLTLGGYADDGESREQIIASAARRCDPEGQRPLVVIGDTAHDIRAAHACGASCIAVPFGHNTSDVLAAAGADRVISTLDGSIVDEITSLHAVPTVGNDSLELRGPA